MLRDPDSNRGLQVMSLTRYHYSIPLYTLFRTIVTISNNVLLSKWITFRGGLSDYSFNTTVKGTWSQLCAKAQVATPPRLFCKTKHDSGFQVPPQTKAVWFALTLLR